ncbi:MAG: HD domain-containing protein [Methanoregula sp.]
MKIIKDPVHGYVEVEEFIQPLLDSPVLQRLRYVRQLGFSYLVYPGANHTRFEHSLGTMHLADVASKRFGLSDDDRKLVVASALLHDIGHGPFSHASEPIMESLLHRTHDQIDDIIDTRLGSLLRSEGIDSGDVCAVVNGTHPLSGIIHGDLDVDRMDYLLRDAYYTGAPYGTVDAHRLIRNILRTDDGIVLEENGMNAAESLLIARTLMRPTVYFHHVSRIGECMFHLAMLNHIAADPACSIESLLARDDTSCMHLLLSSKSSPAREMMQRIYERRLYKRAVYAAQDQVNYGAFQSPDPLMSSRAYAEEIAAQAGCAPSEVLVDIPPFPHDMSMEVMVKNRNATVGFVEFSPRLRMLNETRREQWRLGVYTLPELRDKVTEAATEILHVKKPTRQDTLF